MIKHHHTTHIAPIGFAIFFPTISKADPCIGSNIDDKFYQVLYICSSPIPKPVNAEAKSERISACKFVATITSIFSGLLTITAVAASTNNLVVLT